MCAFAALVIGLAHAPWLGSAGRVAAFNTGRGVTIVLTCAAMMAAARTGPPELRRSHRLFAYALIAGVAGNLVGIGYVALGVTPPNPSLIDVAYAAYLPLTAAALLSVPVGDGTRAARLGILLDGAIAATALLFVSKLLVLAPVWQASGLPPTARAVSVAYPLVDLFLAALALSVIGHVERSSRIVLRYAAAGLILLCVSDSMSAVGTLDRHGRMDHLAHALWETAAALLLLGALRARAWAPSAAGARLKRRSALADTLPYLPLVVAMGVGLCRVALTRTPLSDADVAIAASMVVALITRQAVTVADNRRLTADAVAAADRLRAQQEHFRSLIAGSSDVISLVDAAGVVRYQSPAIGRLLGHPPEAAKGRHLLSLVHPEDRAVVATTLAVALEGASASAVEHRVHHADGRWLYAETSIRDERHNPDVRGLVLNTRLTHDRRMLQERLAHLAFHDTLTGLANLAAFREHLREAIASADADPQIAVVLADLDGFKEVNDSLGHPAGDAVLIGFAAKLKASSRPEDVVARLGGDEFAVLVRAPDPQRTAHAIARRIVQASEQRVVANGRTLVITASVGHAHATPGMSADTLIARADAALYSAKRAGKGRASAYGALAQA